MSSHHCFHRKLFGERTKGPITGKRDRRITAKTAYMLMKKQASGAGKQDGEVCVSNISSCGP